MMPVPGLAAGSLRHHDRHPEVSDVKVKVTLIPDEDAADNIKLAREVCTSCPVMMQCLRHAVRFDIDHGVWGGMLVEERKAWAARELPVAV